MNERAVSSTLSYVLALSIAAILVGGLLTAGGGFVTSQRDVVIREEMSVVGQQLAADIEQADRMVNASSGTTVVYVNRSAPDTVARSQYDIRLDADESQLILNSTNPEQTVRINVSTQTDLRDSTANGGAITVTYDSGALVVNDA